MFKIIILDKIKNLRIKEINLSVKIIRLNGENKNLYIEAVGDTYHSFHKLFFFVRKKNGQTGTVLFPSTHSTFQPPSPSAALNSTSILHRELLFSPPPLYVTYQSFRYRRLLVNSLCQNLAQLCKKPTYRYSRKQSVEGFHSFCQSHGVLFSIKDYTFTKVTRRIEIIAHRWIVWFYYLW